MMDQEARGTVICSQNKFARIMKEFTEMQQKAIKDAGFGDLLKLPLCDIRRNLCMELANSFDLETEEFNIGGNKVRMTIADVEHILGLPSTGDEIKKPPARHVTDLFHWYNWGKDNKISSASLMGYFRDNKNSDDEDFVRIFVLYAIGFYLCPTLQPNVSSDYLGLLENVKELKNINWCSLILHKLISSIRTYRINKAKNLGGCHALPQLWYWEKLYVADHEPKLFMKEINQLCSTGMKKDRRRDRTFTVNFIVDDIRHPIQFSYQHATHNAPNNVKDIQEIKQILGELKLMIMGVQHNSDSRLRDLNDNIEALTKEVLALKRKIQSIMKISTSDNDDDDDGSKDNVDNKKKKAHAAKDEKGTNKRKIDDISSGRKQEQSTVERSPFKRVKKPTEASKPEFDFSFGNNKNKKNEPTAGPSEFRCTAKDNATVAYIKKSQSKKTLVQIRDAVLNKKDMMDYLIRMGIWLNDQHIKNRQGGKTFIINALITTMLKDGGTTQMSKGESATRQHLVQRAHQFLQHDMLFLPVNIEKNHWYLVVVNARLHTIQVLDSTGPKLYRPDMTNVLKALETYFDIAEKEMGTESHTWKDHDVTTWRVTVFQRAKAD
ncbi:hypothetical protein ACP4OV_014160 [Aristida adscensionis]